MQVLVIIKELSRKQINWLKQGVDEQPIRRLNQMKTDITILIYTGKKLFMIKIITDDSLQ